MPTEKRPRAPTKPPKPPKQPRIPTPPLDPIIPPEDAEPPRVRRRGRPRGQTDGPIILACPFAAPDRPNPCVTYPSPVAKGQIKRHLHAIRIRGPNVLSGNETHPQDDPLWDEPEVLDLVNKRLPANKEEQRARLKERNSQAYRKSKSEMKKLRAELEGFVQTGKMTQEEMDSVMLSRLHGQYRVKYQTEIAERLRENVMEARRSEQEAFQRLMARAERVRDQALHFQQHSIDLTTNLTEIFNSDGNTMRSNHLERNGITWPTVPDVPSFYLIYALSVPMACWPADGLLPDISTAFKSAALFIHPDTAEQYTPALGGEDKMKDIMKTFEASRQLINEYVTSTTDEEEKSRHLKYFWETAKHQVCKAMLPNSSSLPPFFISHLVDDAADKLAQHTQTIQQ